MDEERKNDDALFEALNKAKRRKRRRRWITVLIILAIVTSGILYAVNVLRKRVEASMAEEGNEVLTYDASIGSISTRVSGGKSHSPGGRRDRRGDGQVKRQTSER